MTNTQELTKAFNDAEAARLRLIGAVARAYLTGASWQDVADVLGTSRQTAYNRYNQFIPTDPGTIEMIREMVAAEAPATPSKKLDNVPAQLAGQTTIDDAGDQEKELVRIYPGGSLSSSGFSCRYCPFTAPNDEYQPGESMRLAAESGAKHMKEAHHANLSGDRLVG
jgi:hypothetical protein